MNSYVWIHIWIHINYEFIWFFHTWIHMFHEFLYELGFTKVPDEGWILAWATRDKATARVDTEACGQGWPQATQDKALPALTLTRKARADRLRLCGWPQTRRDTVTVSSRPLLAGTDTGVWPDFGDTEGPSWLGLRVERSENKYRNWQTLATQWLQALPGPGCHWAANETRSESGSGRLSEAQAGSQRTRESETSPELIPSRAPRSSPYSSLINPSRPSLANAGSLPPTFAGSLRVRLASTCY